MLSSKNPTIALLDSGIGGTAVLREIIKKYGGGNYIYFADNLFMPYGNKSFKQVKIRLNEIIELLKNKYRANIIIIACNTASNVIRNDKHKNVLIMPFKDNMIYLTTNLTRKILNSPLIISSSRLAKQIENNIFNEEKLNVIVKDFVNKHQLNKLNSFVLGCTHYELVNHLFKIHCSNSLVLNNSKYLLENFQLLNKFNDLNIKIILSKQNKNLENKIIKLIRG